MKKVKIFYFTCEYYSYGLVTALYGTEEEADQAFHNRIRQEWIDAGKSLPEETTEEMTDWYTMEIGSYSLGHEWVELPDEPYQETP